MTKDEIRVLAYMDGYARSDAPDRPVQCETFYDLAQPAPPDEGSTETFYIEPIRIYQKYFNDRFQTYGRQVHFFVYGSGCGESSPETRKSDAAEVRSRVRPFVVLNFAYGDYAPEFDLAMADSGIMSFGGLPNTLLMASVYRRAPGFLWSYLPSFDQLAALYTSYVCKKVVPYPVSFGNPNEFGSKRKIGLLYTNAPGFPDHLYLRDLVIKQVEACGGKVELSRGINPSANDAGAAAQNVALFRQQAITTILWTGHGDIAHPQAAGSTGYTPEVIVLGQPLGMDNNLAAGPFGHPAFMSHAWAVTTHTLQGPPKQEQCGLAIHDGRPEAAESDLTNACIYYRSIFQMFTGIQVAGPRLTPGSVERGLRAIPPHTSSTAKAPACFYEPGDYTCVKDGAAEWWDPQGRAAPPGQSEEVPGCWRMAEKGRRYLSGGWPGGDVPEQRGGANDPCNYVWYG